MTQTGNLPRSNEGTWIWTQEIRFQSIFSLTIEPTAPVSLLVGDRTAEASLLSRQVQTQRIASNLLIQFLYWNLTVINTAF